MKSCRCNWIMTDCKLNSTATIPIQEHAYCSTVRSVRACVFQDPRYPLSFRIIVSQYLRHSLGSSTVYSRCRNISGIRAWRGSFLSRGSSGSSKGRNEIHLKNPPFSVSVGLSHWSVSEWTFPCSDCLPPSSLLFASRDMTVSWSVRMIAVDVQPPLVNQTTVLVPYRYPCLVRIPKLRMMDTLFTKAARSSNFWARWTPWIIPSQGLLFLWGMVKQHWITTKLSLDGLTWIFLRMAKEKSNMQLDCY